MKIKRRVMSLILMLALGLGLLPAAYAVKTDCRYRVIAGGVSHSLAVKEDGTVWAWGSNSAKQVDPSSNKESIEKPTRVMKISHVVSVAAGSDFSAVLLSDKTVMAWGAGRDFFAVSGLSGISSISAGRSTLLALKCDGSVWQWTFGDAAPQQVAGLERICAVAAGGGHYLALSRSGQVWAWGRNDHGQLGTDSEEFQAAPRMVKELTDIVSIAAGYSHSLAVDFNGQVYSWGSNSSGQLGSSNAEDSNTPQIVSAVQKAEQVSAGNEFSMALTEDGKIYTWGYGEYGQLGSDSTDNSRAEPKTIGGGDFGPPVLIASGMNHNLLLDSKGKVYAWGRNRDFQLGVGKNNLTKPTEINLSLTKTVERYDKDIQSELNSWARDDLTALYEKQIVPPSLWEKYDQYITRAEFAHLAVAVYDYLNSSKKNDNNKPQCDFEDVKDHSLKQSIEKAYQAGLFHGRTDTEFAPDAFIPRQETASVLYALVNGQKTPPKASSLSYYSDASQVADWAIPYVAFVHDKNIMLGTGDRFNPTSYTTREQALAIIARLVDKYGKTK